MADEKDHGVLALSKHLGWPGPHMFRTMIIFIGHGHTPGTLEAFELAWATFIQRHGQFHWPWPHIWRCLSIWAGPRVFNAMINFIGQGRPSALSKHLSWPGPHILNTMAIFIGHGHASGTV